MQISIFHEIEQPHHNRIRQKQQEWRRGINIEKLILSTPFLLFFSPFVFLFFRAPVSDEWGGRGENSTHPPPSGIVKSKRPHREISFHHFDYVLLVYLTFSPFFIYLFKRFKSLHFFV
jgi:hypothetical protein